MDPVTAAASAAAQAALKFLATKAAEENHCRPNMDDSDIVTKTFCMAVRGVSGVDETEYKSRLSSQINEIARTINLVNDKADVINRNVNRLLKEMELIHLEMSEAVVGGSAYSAIQDINVNYGTYANVMNGINAEGPASAGTPATAFFKKLIYADQPLHNKLDIIINALVDPIAGKECLLRNIIKQISIKAQNKPLTDCYMLYQEYVNAVMLSLLYGNLLIESAVTYCEVLAENNKLDVTKEPLPLTTKFWKERWNGQLEKLLSGFNSHLEWFVLERSAEAAKGINPFFLPADARQIFWYADAFCSRYLGFGLRGRIFSMGGQFDGTLKLKDGTIAHGVKSAVQIGQKLDYWSATAVAVPGEYDKVDGFSNDWTVHRFYIPGVTVGSKMLDIGLPYSPPAIDIGKIDERDYRASDQLSSTEPALKPFGSFVEIARAGGSFAFLSGRWDQGRADSDRTNTKGAEPDIDQVKEHQRLSVFELRDNGMIAKVSQPEVGLLKGGWFKYNPDRRRRGLRNECHLDGSFSTWMQTAKTISFPALGRNEKVSVVASVARPEGALPDAAAYSNIRLYGPTIRVLKPHADITDDELRKKQVVIGVNYDPTLSIPRADSQVQAGIRLWSIKDNKGSAYLNLLYAQAFVPKHQRDIFRESEVLKETSRSLWELSGATKLKFRLEAFYTLSIEVGTFIEETPFAIYAAGKLTDIHLEIREKRGESIAPPGIDMVTIPYCRFFAFDYDGVGCSDHIMGYLSTSARYMYSEQMYSFGRQIDDPQRFALRRDIDGYYSVLADTVGQFFKDGNAGGGIFINPNDRVLAFDYKASGKLDHLVLYRPGAGAIAILKKNTDRRFEPVYTSRQGIGGYDLANPNDRVLAFDYKASGKLDHLVLYRPGAGACFIVKKKDDGSFEALPGAQGDGGSGIGDCDLKNPADRVFAFDYHGVGKLDHLVLYRPGAGKIWICTKGGNGFEGVYTSSQGIGGYDLKQSGDRALAFDYNSVGKLDHLMFYRPGTGACFIVKKKGDGSFEALPGAQGDPGSGIGGFDLKSREDRAFAFDYDGSGKLDHLVLYRPGQGGRLVVLKKGTQGGIQQIYP